MRYMDHSEARMQLEELEGRGTEHGRQFNGFDSLINAYQVYIDKFNDWNRGKLVHHWCKVVGGAQKGLPVHALQEYWRQDRSMDPTPDFKDKRGKNHGDLVADIGRSDFADSWAACLAARGGYGMVCDHGADDIESIPWDDDIEDQAQTDMRGIVSLKDTRNSQYKELRETLSKAPGLRIR